jgi:PadR family transcriptional regulator, regulatory protein PadR
VAAGHGLFDIGKLSRMAQPQRITQPFLDVLDVLLQAVDDHNVQLHGYAVMRLTKRSGPTVYGVLDRLEDINWVTGRWEEQAADSSKPRRRLYQLTPTGIARARELLAERRSSARSRGLGKVLRPGVIVQFRRLTGSIA